MYTGCSNDHRRFKNRVGAVYNGQAAQGMWSPEERQKHINELEILAILFGLKSFLTALRGKHVSTKSDNSIAVCYINAMSGTKSPQCNVLTKTCGCFA